VDGSGLDTVTRLQVADLGYPQRPERPDSLRGDRLGGQADMVAALVKQRDAAYCQPISALRRSTAYDRTPPEQGNLPRSSAKILAQCTYSEGAVFIASVRCFVTLRSCSGN
jgi:hypothetical protein